MLREIVEKLNPIVIDKANRNEIAKILKTYNSPVYIKDVDGFEVVGNLWNRERLAKFFNVKKEDFIFFMLKNMENLKEKFIIDNSLRDLYINDSSIKKWPIPKYYKNDPGCYITSGVVIVKDEEYGYNLSIHRILVKDNYLVIRMVEQRHLHFLYTKALKEKGYLDVVIAIGCHPAVLLAASTSGDIYFDELKFASTLANGLKVFELDGMLIPEAEFIIKGRILDKLDDEGPFVDITGTYDKVRKQPIIEIDYLLRKEKPIFHALLPGGVEHKALMGLPQEPRMLKFIRNTIPTVKNVVLTEGGCCWLHAVVQIEKRTDGDGKNAILAALAAHPSLKHVVVVDEDINIFDINDVEYAIATRVQGDRDIIIIPGCKGSSLDPSAEKTTTKIGIDATVPLDKKDKFKRVEE
ncbi:UbiD family decarboxylase [Methanocaldococcus indicus]|uniref:UbiD family decarboxylase n=1 Tax=Methanocaldococcus indicus TaxID=213231 RepID=UPI003C6CE517